MRLSNPISDRFRLKISSKPLGKIESNQKPSELILLIDKVYSTVVFIYKA
jgi:hypothetical protein